jgi:hypothetical protein
VDKFLTWLLRWIGITFIAYLGFGLALLIGFTLHSVATAFCPEADMVSGMCYAPWFPWVERGIMLLSAALAGCFVVLFAAAAAERSQRRTAAFVAFAFGATCAMLIVSTSGPSDTGSFLLEALLATAGGLLALYRVHLHLDPARQKARYEAHKKARKEGSKTQAKAQGKTQSASNTNSKRSWGLAARRRRQTAQRGVARAKAPRGRHRRRPGMMLDPGSPSPAIGKASMSALVLLGLWSVFMILVVVTHHTDSMETETLLRFEIMFGWWMLAALLTMLFLVVEMAGRGAVSPARNFRRLATDLFALILVTLMMVCNAQFSTLYSNKHWERNHARIPTHTIRGDFSYPAPLAPGSTANKEWLEFEEWLDRRMYGSSTVRLEFQPQQPIRHLAQCTPDLWRARCDEIRFRVGEGPEHLLRKPWAGWLREALLIPEDGSLDSLVVLPGLEAVAFRDQVTTEDVESTPLRVGPLGEEELNQMIKDSDRSYPLHLVVSSSATVQWLDSLLSRLEERGAKFFVLVFHD